MGEGSCALGRQACLLPHPAAHVGVAGGALLLQSVVLYSLPELDGAIDTVPLGERAGRGGARAARLHNGRPPGGPPSSRLSTRSTPAQLSPTWWPSQQPPLPPAWRSNARRLRALPAPLGQRCLPARPPLPAGGLVGDDIFVIPERITRLASRLKKWVGLRRKPAAERRIALVLYGFPPGGGGRAGARGGGGESLTGQGGCTAQLKRVRTPEGGGLSAGGCLGPRVPDMRKQW